MKVILIAITYIFGLFLGAYLHEGDIQKACKEQGSSKGSTWRGELLCSPVKNNF